MGGVPPMSAVLTHTSIRSSCARKAEMTSQTGWNAELRRKALSVTRLPSGTITGSTMYPSFFAFVSAHDPSHCLDDFHFGCAGFHEQNRVQGGNIHAFGEASGVGNDMTLPIGDVGV